MRQNTSLPVLNQIKFKCLCSGAIYYVTVYSVHPIVNTIFNIDRIKDYN